MQAPCWCTHTTEVSIICSGVMTGGQGIHDPVPYASLPPANEAIIASGAGTIGFRQIAPGSTGAQGS
jgi:hypothetical protein